MSDVMESGVGINTVDTGAGDAVSGEQVAPAATVDQAEDQSGVVDSGGQAEEPVDRMAQFLEVANGEYKNELTQFMKDRLGDRFKKHDATVSDLQGQLSGLQEVLGLFGVEDLNGLKDKAIAESARKKADDIGAPEDAVIDYETKLARQEAEIRALRGDASKKSTDEFLQTMEAGILELSKEFGISELDLLLDKDLEAKVKDGASVEQAFYGLYPDKVKAAMQARKANATRPSENMSGEKKPTNNTPQVTFGEAMKALELARTGKAVDPRTLKVIE